MRKYPHVPQPFVLRVPISEPEAVQSGDEASFGIRLFGPAIEFHPYVVYTVMRMGQNGLGRDRIKFEVTEVTDGELSLLSGSDLLPPRTDTVLDPPTAETAKPTRIYLRLETPLRLQTNGELNASPTVSDLVRSSVRRMRVLSHFYGDHEMVPDDLPKLIESAEKATLLRRETRWHEIRRRSVRQGVEMMLSGTVGELEMLLPDNRVVSWFKSASVCHLGKATSFGYGRITFKVESA